LQLKQAPCNNVALSLPLFTQCCFVFTRDRDSQRSPPAPQPPREEVVLGTCCLKIRKIISTELIVVKTPENFITQRKDWFKSGRYSTVHAQAIKEIHTKQFIYLSITSEDGKAVLVETHSGEEVKRLKESPSQ
jgi:hypothetical protein